MAQERKAKDPNHPGCVIFSVGSNGDFSFDYGMMRVLVNNTCEFHIFDVYDFSEKLPKDLGRAFFHPWGISTQQDRKGQSDMSKWKPQVDSKGRKYFGLKDTIKLLGLENLDTIVQRLEIMFYIPTKWLRIKELIGKLLMLKDF